MVGAAARGAGVAAAAARAVVSRVMKTTKRCPKCSGTRIGIIDGIYDHWSIALPTDLLAKFGIQIGAEADTADAGYRDPAQAPARVPKATSQSDLARTAYVCGACGYYETYVSQPETLEAIGAKGGLRWSS